MFVNSLPVLISRYGKGAVAVATLIAFTSATRADNLLEGGDFESGDGRHWGVPSGQNFSEGHDSGYSLLLNQRKQLLPQDPVEIEPEAGYWLSAFFKAPPESSPVKGFFGVRFFDGNKKLISPWAVDPVAGTDAVLAVEAKAGETSVKVKKTGADWVSGDLFAIAFKANEDWSDLPNANTAEIKNIQPADDEFQVNLKTPLRADYPAGTKVRQHRYVDFPSIPFETTSDWNKSTVKFGGTPQSGTPVGRSFWPGTRFIRVAITITPEKNASDISVLVDDLSLVRE